MKPSIEETLVDWLGAQSIEVKTIEVETKHNEIDQKILYKADGEFYPCGLDPEDDEKALDYHQFTLTDWRFEGTKLTFIDDTKFKIR